MSQSSSAPLQISGGTAQSAAAAGEQDKVQVPVPTEPHVVVQPARLPWAHGKPLSIAVSQSSSAALHVSLGGVQAAGNGRSQTAVQVPVPVVPQAVVHVVDVPWTQAKSSSAGPSQSSSPPLQVSGGGAQASPVGGTQPAVHVPVPVVPHVVVQETGSPGAHCPGSSSSVAVSQSSSMELAHCSIGGVQSAGAGRAHAAVHVPLPVVPQIVSHST
jgi:hypothetical protein